MSSPLVRTALPRLVGLWSRIPSGRPASVSRVYGAFWFSSYSSLPTINSNYTEEAQLKGSDQQFKKDIKTEIKMISDAHTHIPYYDLDGGYVCPFEIIDNPEDEKVILRREFAGESIQVVMGYQHSYLNVDVFITKEDGRSAQFHVPVDYDSDYDRGVDDIVVNGPDGSFECGHRTWMEDTDRTLIEYLEVRGIDYSFEKFVKSYMDNRYKRQYLMLLEQVTGFIGE